MIDAAKHHSNGISPESQSEILKSYWSGLSREERIERSKKRGEGVSRYWNRMSGERRTEVGRNIGEALREHYRNLSGEEREELVQKNAAKFIKYLKEVSVGE